MRSRRIVQAMVLAAVVMLRGLAPAQPGVDWVGTMTGQFDSGETVQRSHVTLERTGTNRLSGTWGPYKMAGSIEDFHIEFTLTDTNGAEAGALRGDIRDDYFIGHGSIVQAKRPGQATASAPIQVAWTITRGSKTGTETK